VLRVVGGIRKVSQDPTRVEVQAPVLPIGQEDRVRADATMTVDSLVERAARLRAGRAPVATGRGRPLESSTSPESNGR
jgi:hypothetical protein